MKIQTIACAFCSRLDSNSEKRVCSAFPKGIPNKILSGDDQHREPFKGDGGLQWSPLLGFEWMDIPEVIQDFDINPNFRQKDKEQGI